MLEPKKNPNPSLLVDPPRLLRVLGGKLTSRVVSSERIAAGRAAFEKKRQAAGQGHEVLYFHQLDDPYSHLTAQVIGEFAKRYDVKVEPHLIRATGGRSQPEGEKLANWARRDCGLVAPHYGLNFPENAGVVPDPEMEKAAALALAGLSAEDFLSRIGEISADMWAGRAAAPGSGSAATVQSQLDEGSARLAKLGHYSGATFCYGGEWWGAVDLRNTSGL